MAASVLPWSFLLLSLLPVAAVSARAGEERAPAAYHPAAAAVQYPDTARKPAAVADTVKTRPAPVALEPDNDQLTRKTTISIVAAIAVLTLTTLLLYNVRSR
jgi:hypothetical protein